jgi:hypothetical protein
MIGLPSFFKRKPKALQVIAATPEKSPPPAPKQDRQFRFAGAAGEKTQDLLTGHDGERVGFRMPLEG